MEILKHIKVVELASVLAGPQAATFFAELGARVIKFENKNTNGDVTRTWKTKSESKNRKVSAYFAGANWGKEHRFVNLKEPSDHEEVLEEIKTADIVIANYKTGSDKKLGMDYESIRKINPTIIYGSITGYGDESSRPAFDAILQAECGLMGLNGTPDSGPVKWPIAMVDLLAAHQLKEGLLLALLERGKSSKGAHVSVSLFDAAIATLANQGSNYLMNNEVPERSGSKHPNIAPYGDVFQCSDHVDVILAVGNNTQFQSLLKILDNEQLIHHEKLSTNEKRVANREFLCEQLKPEILKKKSKEFIDECLSEEVPAAIINDLKQVFELPKAKELVLNETIEGELTRRVKTVIFNIKKAPI